MKPDVAVPTEIERFITEAERELATANIFISYVVIMDNLGKFDLSTYDIGAVLSGTGGLDLLKFRYRIIKEEYISVIRLRHAEMTIEVGREKRR